MTTRGPDAESLAAGLRKVLDRHGYGFQYAVLRRAADLIERGRSQWRFQVSEFPVSTNGFETRIDFVLARDHPRLFLIAECKRANPARSNWCFVRAPYVLRHIGPQPLLFETVTRDGHDIYSKRLRGGYSDKVYHLGFALRSEEKGDPGGQSSMDLEEAAGQVSKALNGLASFVGRNVIARAGLNQAQLVPVVFTTARLWTTDVKLEESDLQKGTLPSSLKVSEEPWVWWQYHISPSLRHDLQRFERHTELSEVLQEEYARSIAIVSPAGIDDFLGLDWPI